MCRKEKRADRKQIDLHQSFIRIAFVLFKIARNVCDINCIHWILPVIKFWCDFNFNSKLIRWFRKSFKKSTHWNLSYTTNIFSKHNRVLFIRLMCAMFDSEAEWYCTICWNAKTSGSNYNIEMLFLEMKCRHNESAENDQEINRFIRYFFFFLQETTHFIFSSFNSNLG